MLWNRSYINISRYLHYQRYQSYVLPQKFLKPQIHCDLLASISMFLDQLHLYLWVSTVIQIWEFQFRTRIQKSYIIDTIFIDQLFYKLYWPPMIGQQRKFHSIVDSALSPISRYTVRMITKSNINFNAAFIPENLNK